MRINSTVINLAMQRKYNVSAQMSLLTWWQIFRDSRGFSPHRLCELHPTLCHSNYLARTCNDFRRDMIHMSRQVASHIIVITSNIHNSLQNNSAFPNPIRNARRIQRFSSDIVLGSNSKLSVTPLIFGIRLL
jgi:hypothetical protein